MVLPSMFLQLYVVNHAFYTHYFSFISLLTANKFLQAVHIGRRCCKCI